MEFGLKRSETFFTFLKLPVDILAILTAFIGAYFLRQIWEIVPISYMWPFESYLRFTFLILPVWILVFAAGGLYKTTEVRKSTEQILPVFLSTSTTMMIILVYIFFSRSFFFSRLIILYVWVLTFLFVLAGRFLIIFIQRYLYKYGIGVHRVTVLGGSEFAKSIISEIQNNRNLGLKLVGTILKDKQSKTRGIGKFLGPLKEISQILKENPFDELVCAEPALSENQVLKLVEFCEDKKIIFKLCPNLFNVRSTNVAVETLAAIPIIEFKKTPLEGWGRICKRTFDLLISLLLLIILSPLFAMIAVAIKLDSQGPVFFKHKRVGAFGKIFTFYKFRSMIANAESLYPKLTQTFAKRRLFFPKIKNDPRITAFGQFLRRTFLDELPQLFNVLLGELSLVGPRPLVPEEFEKVKNFEKRYRLVSYVKPGMTGLWQVSGRTNLSDSERINLDLYYLENWSPWLDFQILLKTISVLLKEKGRNL